MTETTAAAKTSPGTTDLSTPRRKTTPVMAVAAYATLAEAKRARELLVKAGLDTAGVAIHGTNLTDFKAEGRRFWQRPFYRGALSGLGAGAVVGVLFGLLSLVNVVTGIIYTLLSQMVLGAVTGLVGFIVARARGGFEADEAPRRFEIVVPTMLAEEAGAVLHKV